MTHPPRPGTGAIRLNDLVCSSITAGRYRLALAADPLRPAARIIEANLAPFRRAPTAADDDDSARLLVQINLAEAEYNLGRWEAAEHRVSACFKACQQYEITRAGCWQQLAWILAHVGRAEAAVPLITSVDPLWLPESFRAEHHFTRAVVYLSLSDLDRSEAALRAAEPELVRLSSVRNYLFLAARLARARGDRAAAERLCQEAAESVYTGQGGDGLVLWGDLLAERGAWREARGAWSLARRRDPESAWAEIAKVRLAPKRG